MLEHPSATNFCNLVMNGEWDKVTIINHFFLFKAGNARLMNSLKKENIYTIFKAYTALGID